MKIANRLLSKWFTPNEEHLEIERAISRYQGTLNKLAEQLGMVRSFSCFSHSDIPAKVEAIQRNLSDSEERRRSLEADLAKQIEINNLMRAYIKPIASLVLSGNISEEDLLTDRFYSRFESVLRLALTQNQVFERDLRKIVAIALRDGSLEESASSLDAEVIDKILNAIAGLRGEIADLKEREQNYIEALRLSQQEVKQAAEAHAETKAWYRQQCEEMLAIATKISQGLD